MQCAIPTAFATVTLYNSHQDVLQPPSFAAHYFTFSDAPHHPTPKSKTTLGATV